jgi:flagella basal body P-ring formation protein FlgA
MSEEIQMDKVTKAQMKGYGFASFHIFFTLCLSVLVSLCLIPASSSAQTITGESVKSAVENYIKKSVPPSIETVIEFKDLKQSYPASAKEHSVDVSSANSVNMRGLVTFLVKVHYSRNDNGGDIIPVTVKVRTFQNVLVATQTIQPHCRIESDQVSVVRTETTDLPNPVIDLNQLKNKWTSRWIQDGKALTFDMFAEEPIVKRGDNVMIVVRTKNIVVREEGNALQDGKLNDVINVVNEYRDNLRAKVTGKGEVVLVN